MVVMVVGVHEHVPFAVISTLFHRPDRRDVPYEVSIAQAPREARRLSSLFVDALPHSGKKGADPDCLPPKPYRDWRAGLLDGKLLPHDDPTV